MRNNASESEIKRRALGHMLWAIDAHARSPSLESRVLATRWMACTHEWAGEEIFLGGLDQALALLLAKPSSWRTAALVCSEGGRIKWKSEPQARSLVACALSQRVSGRGEVMSAAVRVACVEAILGAMGSSIRPYKGKGGEPFDALAMGALWTWHDADLSNELSRAGLAWSDRSRRDAAKIAAARLDREGENSVAGVSFLSMETAIRVLDSVCGQEGLGPFGKDWEKIVRHMARHRAEAGQWSNKVAFTNEARWGASLARWGTLSSWGPEDWVRVDELCPIFRLHSPALAAAMESSELKSAVKSPVLAATRAKVRL